MLAAVVLAASSPASAGINTWTGIGPDGGRVRKIILPQGSSDPVYALADASGFFRSLDGGSHWQQNTDDIAARATDFVVDPANPDRVFLVIDQLPSRVLLSVDAGATFSTLYAFPQSMGTPTNIAISADGNTLYCLSAATVMQSTDRGQSWQQRTNLPSTSFPAELQVDPSDANTLYVARFDGLLTTHDGGATWTNITPPGASVVDSVAVDPTNGNRLWAATVPGLSLSTDRGASWTPATSAYATSVALDPRSPSTVYVATFEGSVLEGNGGTWTDITGNLGSFAARFIAVSPRDGATLVVANERGVWITANGGAAWTLSDTGLFASSVAGFEPASARGRVYVKGSTIGELVDGTDSVTPLDQDALYAAVGSRISPVTALAPVSESGGGLIVAVGNQIARSIDDGVTWSRLPYTIAANDTVFDLAATTTFPSIYYASSQLTLQRSLDFGATWTAITTGLPAGASPGLIAIAPSNPAVIYAGPRNVTPGLGVYRSVDGGDSWAPANAGLQGSTVLALAVHPTQPDIVYAGTNTGLMKTLDGGITWTALQWSPNSTFTGCNAVVIDAANPNIVYAASGNAPDLTEVARSADGGATWAHLTSTTDPVPWGATSLAIDPARQNTLRVGTASAGVREITLQQDLAIQLSPLAPALTAGVPVSYTVQVSNLGHLPSTGVDISIALPAGSSVVTANANIGSCTVAASGITCAAPTMNGDDSITITGTITPGVAGEFELTGSVRADQSDGDMSNNTSTQSSAVSIHTNLGAYISGGAQGVAGDLLYLPLSVTNAGPSPASGVHATYQVPAGITIKSFTAKSGTCAQTSASVITCDIASLASGSTMEMDTTLTVASAGNYVLTASVSGQGTDDFPADNMTSFPLAISPGPPVGGTPPSAGSGGGGGGALSPLFLLGLLTFSLGGKARVGRVAMNPSR